MPTEIKRKLPEVVKLQVDTLSPWPAAEIYWDFSVEVPKKDQKLVTVTIVMIPRTQVDPWITFFRSVGLPLSGTALSSVAQGHGICALWSDATPSIVLHREESYTEGILVQGSRLAAFTGPSAEGDIVPKVLVDRLLSAAKLTTSEGSRLIVCGNLDESASETNPPLPLEDIKPDSTKDFGSIATALLPLKETAFRSNLVPAELRYRESRRRLMPAFVLGFFSILMGIALAVREPYQSASMARLKQSVRKLRKLPSRKRNWNSYYSGIAI